VGGAVLALDLTQSEPAASARADPGTHWVECLFTVTLAVHGEPASAALRGLGFARAFGEADTIRFECPGLLPTEGYEIPGQAPATDDAEETWAVAATVALALDGLERRGAIGRVMPASVGPRDLARAQIVLHLLGDNEVAVEVKGDFEAPLPPDASLDDDPSRWMTFTAELPPLLGQPTALIVQQTVEGAVPLRIVASEQGAPRLVCHATGDVAWIVSRLVDNASD
jgi:hypothetical protein